MEQPPGGSSRKRARGANYVPSLEAIAEDIDEMTVWDAEGMQLRLHTLAVELTQVKPGRGAEVFRRLIEQLECELGKAKASVEKRKRNMANKQRKPRRSESVSGSSDLNSNTQLTVCDREALGLSNEKVEAI